MRIENVGDYPRPPALERCGLRLTIQFGGETIANTDDSWRVLETFHPPTYYLPRSAFAPGVLVPIRRRSMCEWKGQATYFDVISGNAWAEAAAWTYPTPTARFAALQDHVAVYAEPMEECRVGGEVVIPQPGNFYGGWVTPNIIGPIKGAPGTTHW